MSEAVIAAVLSGGIALIGTILTVVANSILSGSKMNAKLDKSQAVMQTRLDEIQARQSELTKEVREHNEYGRRLPVVEEQIKVINHRLADLEEGKK